jgi:hypothetical protein
LNTVKVIRIAGNKGIEEREEKSCLMEESLMITRLWVFFLGSNLRE